ncbi:MAG: type I restriction enzyme HsdR N-terminal domain-containing protein [Bryobacteraceae bacterium]
MDGPKEPGVKVDARTEVPVDIDFNGKVKILDVKPSDGRFFDLSSLKYRRATPEEYVRAGLVRSLAKHYGYPPVFIQTEYALYKAEKFRYRADIVVWADEERGRPNILIEVKERNVGLTSAMVDKLHEYAYCFPHGKRPEVLVLTNGERTAIIRQKDRVPLAVIPTWKDARAGEYGLKPSPAPSPFVRPSPSPFELSERQLRGRISKHRDVFLAKSPVGLNAQRAYLAFYEMLRDERADLAKDRRTIRGYRIMEDRGVRWSSLGNASGGGFYGRFRHLLLRTGDGGERNFYLSVSPYLKNLDDGIDRSDLAIIGGIDEKQTLQLQSTVPGSSFAARNATLLHRGHIALGEGGRVSRRKVVDYVRQRAPNLVEEETIVAGKLDTAALNKAGATETVLRLAILSDLLDQLRDETRKAR